MSTHVNTNTLRAHHAGRHKKTALAASIALTLVGGLSMSATAALPDNAVLNFTAGIKTCILDLGTPPLNCTYGTNILPGNGSYFAMDKSGEGVADAAEKFAIAPNDKLIIGTSPLTPQPASGSHDGLPNGSENPGIDMPWDYFGNTGMHYTSKIVTATDVDANTQTLDMSGWGVTWNGISAIDMGGGIQDCGTSTDGICVDSSGTDFAGTSDNGTGIATLVCGAISGDDCATNGVDFVLDYEAIVPRADPSNFGGVRYFLHMEGTISLGGPPILGDDSATTIAANPITISVLDNDIATADDPIDPTSITISTQASNGIAAPNTAGTITYTPATGPNYVGPDTFAYTAANVAGTSAPATVSVTVAENIAPVAIDDTVVTSTAVLGATGGQLANINILANDTDTNNSPGLPGGIDVATVDATTTPGNIGTCTKNADGTINYTQPSSTVATVDTCTYTVMDVDPVNGALTSNTATLTITVTETVSDWPETLPAGVIPILTFEPGIPGATTGDVPEKSWFSMLLKVQENEATYTPLKPGPDGGIIVGYEQPAKGSHNGAPNGSEQPGLTAPWVFFSNTGFDLTRNGGVTPGDGIADSDGHTAPVGTLNFRHKYVVTWNGIEIINLGGSSQFPTDLGYATIICSDKPCQDGSTFVLDYDAHVEDLPGFKPSNFNAVAYGLHMEGTVRFLDGALNSSEGTVTSETRLPTDDVAGSNPDDNVDLQCVGGCFDYTIDGVTAGSRVSIVLPLAGGVPNFPVWRILDNGVWRDFDTSTGDSVKTAPMVVGGSAMECPSPGDLAYIDLDNGSSVNVGHQCVQLSITDNGLNDLDPADGTISDPSGMAAAGAPVIVNTPGSSTGGCSIAATPVALNKRADWWLLAGVLGWLGWNRRKRVQH